MCSSLLTVASSIGVKVVSPTLYLAISIFFTEWAKRSSLMRLFWYAFFIASKPLGRLLGISSMSFPAKKASTSTSPIGRYSDTPFIPSASVKISPSYPIFFFSKSVIIVLESDEGNPFLGSKAGTFR